MREADVLAKVIPVVMMPAPLGRAMKRRDEREREKKRERERERA